MSDTAPGEPGPTAKRDRAERLSRLRTDQRRRWERGEPARVESYLRQQPTLADDAEAVLDLVMCEVSLREQRGESPPLEEYLERFPRLEPALRRQFQLHDALRTAASAGTTSSFHLGQVPETSAPAKPAAIAGYELLGELGRGGMGVVYKARQVSLDRVVALKMVLSGAYAGEEELARFRREAEAAARLEHPNLVHIYEVGEHDGRPYFSLEFVDGGNLLDQIDGKPQPPALAARLVETLARAMHYAHERGIIHRDLKPANILLSVVSGQSSVVERERGGALQRTTDNGQRTITPKITDFGLAKRLDGAGGQTRSGEMLGTPSYMAPEQAAGRNREIGPPTDVYALGVILYEMLIGRPPFLAETVLDTVNQVITQDPVPPRRLQPNVPRDLETICLKCLEKEPRRRYPTARDLADDLRRFLGGEPIRARPAGPVERALKWARRRPAVAALLGVCALAALVLVAGGLLYHVRLQKAFGQAEERAEEARRLLVRLHVARGTQLMDEGESFAALVWLAEALRLEKDDAALQEPHRARLAAVLRQCPRLVQLWPHQGPVRHVAFSPDGGRVATAGDDHATHVWDVATGRRVGAPLAHQGPVHGVAFSADGRRLVTADDDGTARVWDATTGQALTPPMKHDRPVTGASFSPDGTQVLTFGEDSTARLWDAATGKSLRLLLKHEGPIRHAGFSADGRRVATAGADRTARVWDAATGQPVTPPLVHDGAVNHAAFHPNGERLVTAADDHAARIWDVAQAKQLGPPLRHAETVSRAVFSPDGRHVLTAGDDDRAQLWDAATGEQAAPPLKHGSDVRHAAFSPDGRRVITTSDDNTARVWDAATGEPLTPPLPHTGTVRHAELAPDGRHAITAGDDKMVRFWDLAGRGLLASQTSRPPEEPRPIASPDGRRVIKLDGSAALICSAVTGEPVVPPLRHGKTVNSAAFNPDGRRVVTAGDDNTARVWDTDSGQPVTPPLTHGSAVQQAAFSPDGRRVVTASGDNTVRVWDADTGAQVLPPLRHQGTVESVVFSSDGRWIASGSKDRTARVWDARTGEPLTPALRHSHTVKAVSSGAGGRQVITRSNDQEHVWDVPTDERPTADLVLLAQLLAGSRIDATDGLRPLEPDALHGAWQSLRPKYPRDLAYSSAGADRGGQPR